MWIALALGPAFFAGVVAVLAKVGIRHTSSNVATAIRTVIALTMAWIAVFVVGAEASIATLSTRSVVFLVLSGLATGASWLCYFRAIQLGPVNKVVAVDRSGLVLTVLLGILVFGEAGNLWATLLAAAVIAVGTVLMIDWRSERDAPNRRAWLVFAGLSAAFASLTAVLAKIGISDVDASVGTAVRTSVVLVMAVVVVLAAGEQRQVRSIPRRDLWFIALSGLATGASWLCLYQALKQGPVSVVIPIDKLSIVVTVVFSYLVLRERLTRAGLLGLILIVVGTFALVLAS